MTKQKKLWWLLITVFLVAFNLIFFILGGAQQNDSIWIAYGFIHFSYLMLVLMPFFIRQSGQVVLGMSLYTIAVTYFLVTFLCGLVFIFRYPKEGTLSLVIQIIITGIYAITFLAHMLANERTGDALAVHEVELRFVKESANRLQGIQDQTKDDDLKKKIETAYDLAHASQVKTSHSVHGLEASILENIGLLENAVAIRDQREMDLLLDQIIKGIEKRNRLLKFQQ